MPLSTRAKVAIGIVGAASVAGIVAATRKPAKKKKKPGKHTGPQNGGNGNGTPAPSPGTGTCPPTQRLVGYDMSGNPICVDIGGLAPAPAVEPVPGDTQVMETQDPNANHGYTSFFTQQSEQMIRSDLQAWKNANPAADCNPVVMHDFDPSAGEGGVSYLDHFPAARQAAVSVLTQRYPTGGSAAPINWSGALGSSQLWINWLFRRVEKIAEKVVCDYSPQ